MIAEYVVGSGALDNSTTAIRTAFCATLSPLADASLRAQPLANGRAARMTIAAAATVVFIARLLRPCRSRLAPTPGPSMLERADGRRRRASIGPSGHRSAALHAGRSDCARRAAIPRRWPAAPSRLPAPVAPRALVDADV